MKTKAKFLMFNSFREYLFDKLQYRSNPGVGAMADEIMFNT